MKKNMRLIFIIACVYVTLVAAMYVFQRYLQYFPFPSDIGTPAGSGVPEMQAATAKTNDGLENVLWFAPPKTDGGKVIVLFHGNAGNIAGRAFKARVFIDKGYGVLLCEYRGYGGNAGSPTEAGLYNDARACLKWLEEKGYAPASIVIYGESIGSGVAVQMALETQPRRMILESPFSSAADVAQSAYPWVPAAMLLKDKYESVQKIGAVTSDLLIVHGDSDMVIPARFAKKLFNAARDPKAFVTVKGAGHNDMYQQGAWKPILEWLEKPE